MSNRGPLIASAVVVAAIAVTVLAISVGGGSGGSSAAGNNPTTGRDPGTTQPPSSSNPDTTLVESRDFELPRDLAAVSEDWITDFSKRTIDFDELVLGIRAIPIRDRIRPIDDPQFVAISEVGDFLDDREPGLAVDLDGDARFYPLSILTSHEVLNDVFGDTLSVL